jgi:hypothetical protein
MYFFTKKKYNSNQQKLNDLNAQKKKQTLSLSKKEKKKKRRRWREPP